MKFRDYENLIKLGREEQTERLVNFLKKYTDTIEEANELVEAVYAKTTLEDNGILIMLNKIARVSDIIDDAKREYEIKLFFIFSCIDSMYDSDFHGKKRKMFQDFFNNYIEEEEKQILIRKIKHSNKDERYNSEKNEEAKELTLSIDEISDLFYEIRNKLAHEGDYNYFSFGSEEAPQLNVINIIEDGDKEEIERLNEEEDIKLNIHTYKKFKECQRTFEISISYEELKYILVKGMIRQLKSKL